VVKTLTEEMTDYCEQRWGPLTLKSAGQYLWWLSRRLLRTAFWCALAVAFLVPWWIGAFHIVTWIVVLAVAKAFGVAL
jgi:hypothetical protein